jgi:DNA-binding Lrp family transcriptional regulator
MERAYILVKTKVDTQGLHRLVNTLTNHKSVKLVDLIYGHYDLIVISEASDRESLGRFILNEIRSLPGVYETVTFLAFNQHDSEISA